MMYNHSDKIRFLILRYRLVNDRSYYKTGPYFVIKKETSKVFLIILSKTFWILAIFISTDAFFSQFLDIEKVIIESRRI